MTSNEENPQRPDQTRQESGQEQPTTATRDRGSESAGSAGWTTTGPGATGAEGSSQQESGGMRSTATPAGGEADGRPQEGGEAHLMPTEVAQDMRARWDAVQGAFVDDPRRAVNDADNMVSDVLQRLSATFETQHKELEGQWKNGEPSTDDLRTAFHRYRSFFNRLLEV
ncbi:hypothetical protein A8924_5892 [Saccharopolyspora erythraea NRRL 2338]|uniref:Uncharacterized protein n=2 Tax=Saccharopolyspora erythraea TaxID=1836 RepID=A4FL14_SACEN|nr:hypothetical protein [Saccharopolyspora erythraea]EQD84154.1 hypothetical protein N599_21620 [Saccharopolyspora erythraea D]PFG98379.1 hypothetical protein A8924_5892 [Saccharopolyspora erythraea NRRL 2338]QRK88449.1 hypothetical protein JQX30_27845 [Saccharopolyspora erythraea]CAM04739.1 hypothetical protein SACE_5553 [Saccharopolyspora erythraea NRRL 2338]